MAEYATSKQAAWARGLFRAEGNNGEADTRKALCPAPFALKQDINL